MLFCFFGVNRYVLSTSFPVTPAIATEVRGGHYVPPGLTLRVLRLRPEHIRSRYAVDLPPAAADFQDLPAQEQNLTMGKDWCAPAPLALQDKRTAELETPTCRTPWPSLGADGPPCPGP